MRALVMVVCVCALAAPTTQGDDSEVADAMMRWFDDAGGVRSGLRLTPVASGPTFRRFETVTDVALKEYDRLLTVPLDIVMWRGTALASSRSAVRQAFERLSDDSEVIELFLLRQAALGKASPWAPYVAALPRHVPVSWHFDDDALEALQDATAAEFARERRRSLYARFQALRPTIRAVVKGIGSTEHFAVWTSFEAFAWAVAVVSSRALSLRGDMYLVPMADMVSYQPKPTYREAHSGDSFLRFHRVAPADDAEDGPVSQFQVLADRDMPAGGLVAEDYGDVPSSVFLHHHGFLPDPNPFDCVQLPLRDVELSPAATEVGRLVGLAPLVSTCVKPGGLSTPATQLLNLRHLDATGLQRCRGVARTGMPLHAVRAACLSAGGLSVPAMQDVAAIANATLDAFGTTLAQDWDLLAADAACNSTGDTPCSNLTEHQRLAITFRASRKVLMRKVADHYTQLVSTGGTAAGEPLVSPEEATAGDSAGDFADDDTSDAIVKRHNLALQRAVVSFNRWLASKQAPSVVQGDFKVAATEGTDAVGEAFHRVQLVATGEAVAGSAAVRVAPGAVFDASVALELAVLRGEVVQRALQAVFPVRDAYNQQAMLLGLMAVRYDPSLLQGAAVRALWKQYLSLVPPPAAMTSHHAFTPPEWHMLSTEGVGCEGWRRQGVHERAFEALWDGVLRRLPSHFPADVFSRASYMWAAAMVGTRAVWWDDAPHVVPLVDFAGMEVGVSGGGDLPVVGFGGPGRWVELSLPATFGAVPGEAIAVPLFANRVDLFLDHGRSAALPAAAASAVDVSVAGLHPGDCLWLEVGLCSTHPGFADQLLRLRQHAVFTTTAGACVPVTSLLSHNTSVAPADLPLLDFVRGATGLRSAPAARACLRRLVAAAAAQSPPERSLDDNPSPVSLLVSHFLEGQRRLASAVAANATRPLLDAGADPVCAVSTCGGAPSGKSLWQPPAGAPIGSKPSCGVCTTCADLAASYAGGRHVF